MGIKHTFITGDTHGMVRSRLQKLKMMYPHCKPEETQLVILGDNGINFGDDDFSNIYKQGIENEGYYIFCIRGNHDKRPQDVPTIEYDTENDVMFEPQFPHILYAFDGFTYGLDKYKALVIGGAYSIDKQFRLAHNLPWFENEQLSAYEQKCIYEDVINKDYDIVLTHTCPLQWQPKDLFVPSLGEENVDRTMEKFLQKIERNINYKRWAFGHYHDNRQINNKAWLLYEEILPLSYIMRN